MTKKELANSGQNDQKIFEIFNLCAKIAFAMMKMIEINSKMTEKLILNSDICPKF